MARAGKRAGKRWRRPLVCGGVLLLTLLLTAAAPRGAVPVVEPSPTSAPVPPVPDALSAWEVVDAAETTPSFTASPTANAEVIFVDAQAEPALPAT